MKIVVYDIEVFKYDWIVVFYDTSLNTWTVYHNDNKGVREFMERPGQIFCGFNNKRYDNLCTKAMSCGASPELIKQINDFIIVEDRSGWDHWFLKQNRFWFDSFDLMDDTQVGTSLKSIEANRGDDIVETGVDFNIDRPLTPEELQLEIDYCKADVLNTAKLLTLRKNYLQTKLNVGRQFNIPDHKALYMSNAMLTATALGAKPVERYDEREYQYPDNLDKSMIPPEVLAFFDRMRDKAIPDEEIFSSSIEIQIGECPVKLGFGGIHGAIPNYRHSDTDQRLLRNFDVASYYPSLMIKNGYTSRNIPSPEVFESVFNERIAAKKAGDKVKSDALKLILNTTYGASLASTNPLYDPLMGRSVCISGQLYLLELAQRLYRDIPDLRVVQLNTDGIMFELDEQHYDQAIEILNEWQQRTGFALEEDKIRMLIQKDVNNYLLEFENGKIKTKGGYFSYGIPAAGAFSINNNFVIVKQAVIEYFTKCTPVEDTINSCQDIHKFQIIAKAGGGYESVFRVPGDFEQRKKRWQKENRILVREFVGKSGKIRREWKNPPFTWENYDGPRREVQRVNRVYASVKPNMGTLVKIKPDGTVGKIGGLPDSCIIDNRNRLTLADVDKQWYIDLARKYIEDYTGEPYGKS
jgi:hypothetical protein